MTDLPTLVTQAEEMGILPDDVNAAMNMRSCIRGGLCAYYPDIEDAAISSLLTALIAERKARQKAEWMLREACAHAGSSVEFAGMMPDAAIAALEDRCHEQAAVIEAMKTEGTRLEKALAAETARAEKLEWMLRADIVETATGIRPAVWDDTFPVYRERLAELEAMWAEEHPTE